MLSSTGCFYHQFSPRVDGRVIDGKTDVPIRGAEVTLSSYNDKVTVITGEDGTFSIPRTGDWAILWMDLFPPPITLIVRSYDCEPPFVRSFERHMHPKVESPVLLGDLRLKCTWVQNLHISKLKRPWLTVKNQGRFVSAREGGRAKSYELATGRPARAA
jgi:hypothetical protein